MDSMIKGNEHVQRFQIALAEGNLHTASCSEIYSLCRVKMRNKNVCASKFAYFTKGNIG